MNMERRIFPESFVFGASVAPYQVEGNVSEKRHNDWDEYFKENPKQQPFKTEEVGPDWFTFPKAEEDINRLKELGLGALRLGIEWARIEPEEGKIDTKAIHRYREIFNNIHQAGLVPLATLNHFTLPDWMSQRGGYSSSVFDSRFKNYTERIADNFGDVKQWITLNEPMTTVTTQYLFDAWPPKKPKILSVPRVLNNMGKANAQAYESIKRQIPDSEVGSSHAMIWLEPEDKTSGIQRKSTDILNYFINKAPIDIVTDRGNNADFIGYNYYTGYFIKPTEKLVGWKMNEEGLGIAKTLPPCFEVIVPEGYKPDTGWPIVPEFFLHSLQYLHKSFPKKPIIITENGIADKDDKYRSFYVLTHLVALHEAIQKGVDIRGYYYWSLIDNLEWMGGYNYKFGLIDLNPTTGERVVRQSAELYKKVATSGIIDVEELAEEFLTPEQKNKAMETNEAVK
jgi:beta-glucosidase